MEINEFIDKVMNENLIDMILSGAKKAEFASKIKIRPVIIKDSLKFQVTRYEGKKVLHENMAADEAKEYVIDAAVNCYKQTQVVTVQGHGTILSGKRGSVSIKYKSGGTVRVKAPLSHNRSKKYIINEGDNILFMQDLGVMTSDGKIVRQKYDKFRQINRFLEFIEDIIPQLDKDREQTIIDFGCGKSYLTFAIYHYLKVMNGYNVKIIGLDLKEDVIEECSQLAQRYGYDGLEFLVGDIASYNGTQQADMVVTLHACDTATDYALYKAVKWGAKVILSVPCCQHEANGQIKGDLYEPVLKYGILKERMAALVTDAVRANILEEHGYKTQILEFIDMEHTPKNLLIRAVKDDNAKTGEANKASDKTDNMASDKADNKTSGKMDNVCSKSARRKELEESMNLKLTLERLFEE